MLDSLTNFFSGGQQQGYGDMMKYIQQGMNERRNATDQANGYLDPYFQAGRGEMPGYMKNYQSMLNPNQFIGNMMKDYTQSGWAKKQLESGNNAMTNAAAASGGLGGSDFLRSMADYNQGITAADQQRYLDNAMGVWNGGLDRQGNMVGMGYNAGNQMGQNRIGMANGLAQDYGNMANANLQRQNSRGIGMSNMLGFAGGMFGGPFGAAAGSMAGSMMGGRR